MSGFGERFKKAGYKIPKPLIEVEEKPIIAHVIDMFPGETDFIFICNKDHLAEPKFRMREILEYYCSTGNIVAIDPHKLGPVHAVLQATDYINPEKPTIVNYCDFSCYWDYADFKRHVVETKCDGSIPAYKDFHPHSLAGNHYAFIRNDGTKVLDIQEKQPFTKKPISEYASSGTYYFSSGYIAKKYFEKTKQLNLTVNNEYYVSLVYKPMLADKLAVTVYELEHFMQWGTPEDLHEYNYWSNIYKDLVRGKKNNSKHSGAVLIPMAGLGKRFSDEDYSDPKPFIEVSGKPMVEQAVNMLPQAEKYNFVTRKDLPKIDLIEARIKALYPNSDIITLDGATDGQARTCLLGMKNIDMEKPLTIGACDNGAIYDGDAFNKLINGGNIDVIVWGIRNHPDAVRNPNAFGWIGKDKDSNNINKVSVKTPLSNPKNDPIIIGTFTFKKAQHFIDASTKMIERSGKINNEFYVDTTINDAIDLGLTCVLFEVDQYLGWGSPNDLKCFEYWQSCFNKWHSHPYSIEKDESYEYSKKTA